MPGRSSTAASGALLVDGALRYPWVWLTPGDTATSVWIPPGGSELSAEAEESFEATVRERLGLGRRPGAGDVRGLRRQPPARRPALLPEPARAPTRRSSGEASAWRLLAENLRRIDAEGAPAYLEASNSANVPLYQRFGFQPIGSFVVPDGGPEVVTMWRDPA